MNTFTTDNPDIIETVLSGEAFKYITVPRGSDSDSTHLVFECSRLANRDDILVLKPDGSMVGVFAEGDKSAPSVTALTAAAREYISSMSEDELIEHGHAKFNGKDQMIAALHTIDLLAAHDEEEARAAYHGFLESNLSGTSFVLTCEG